MNLSFAEFIYLQEHGRPPRLIDKALWIPPRGRTFCTFKLVEAISMLGEEDLKKVRLEVDKKAYLKAKFADAQFLILDSLLGEPIFRNIPEEITLQHAAVLHGPDKMVIIYYYVSQYD